MSTSRGGGSNGSFNGNKGNNANSNYNGVASIPAASRKMVQSLKEIVNCPEVEIYAMLKECNMDPNEAVNRLLSQDPFHEVKSKREKKKENNATDSRSRGAGITSSRGARGGVDRYGARGSVSQPADSGALRGKTTYKKDNVATTNNYQSFAPSMVGNDGNRRLPPSSFYSDASSDNKASINNSNDGISSAHPSSGFQSAWAGVPGQVSMAEVVKRGRLHGKPPSNVAPSQQDINHHFMEPPAAPSYDMHSAPNYAAKVPEANQELGFGGSQHVSQDEDWPLDEQEPAPGISSVAESSLNSHPYTDASNLSYDRMSHRFDPQMDEVRFDPQMDEVRYAEDGVADHTHTGVHISDRNIEDNNSEGTSGFDNYQVHQHSFEQQEAVENTSISVSSVATNLQHLSLLKEDEDSPREASTPAVKIPDHLQVQAADCPHLSFGSFGSGTNAPPSAPFASRPGKSDMEEASAAVDAPMQQSDAREPEYFGDEHLGNASDGNIAQRLGASAGNYDRASASQPDILKQEAAGVPQGDQYAFPSSGSNYSFENNQQQLNASFSHPQTNTQSQIPNLSSLSGVMAYSNALPSTLLASSIQPTREAELSYSPFPLTQSMPTKYSGNVSSITGPAMSMNEALKNGNFTSAQPTQNLPGSSISGGPALPQQLAAMHAYSQPSLPLGHFANMIGYPLMPQSYTYMPSAFQQAFGVNSSYHQNLAAAVLPQYKNNVSASSLPQSATLPTGYGGAFGSSTNIPGNFHLNPPTAPAGTSMGYDDVLSSQYKDANHMLSLQQVPGSRTMSAVPASTYYSFQGQQGQQPAGFRQNQQPSQQQHYGSLGGGYPNFYNSQSGLSLEHQQQLTRDGSMGGSQGQQPKQAQQLWQNSY